MNRFELVKKLAIDINVSYIKSNEIIKIILEGIILGVCQDGRTIIKHFGVFRIKQTKKRNYYCHFTGKNMKSPANKIPAFRPSKELKKIINSD